MCLSFGSSPSLPNHQVGTTDGRGGTGFVSTALLIVNAALGAGLLNFPRAFSDAGGLAVALLTQLILLAFVLGALAILAHCADQRGSSTVQETMASAFGRWAGVITSICVILYTLGTTVTFVIIIGDQFDRAFASLYGPDFCHHWYMRRDFTMVVSSIVVILPMCYSRRIDFLRIPSALGVLAILYVVALIAYEYFFGGFVQQPVATFVESSSRPLTDIFLVVPDLCFGYQCHVSAIPIYSCMKNRSLWRFVVCSGIAVGICAVCYTVAGACGYLTFGDAVDNDILVSYPPGRPEVLVAVALMAIKTFTTYPILLFCGREAVVSLVTKESDGNNNGGRVIFRAVVSTVWFAVSLALAVLIPNIGDVIRVLGSLAAVFIFVLPGLGLFQLANRTDPSFYLWKTRMYIVVSAVFTCVGAFLFGVVITQAVQHKRVPVPLPLCQ